MSKKLLRHLAIIALTAYLPAIGGNAQSQQSKNNPKPQNEYFQSQLHQKNDTELQFSENVTIQDICELFQKNSFPFLESLTIKNISINASHAHQLSEGLKHALCLANVSFIDNKLDVEGITHISEWLKHLKLNTLTIAENNLGYDGVKLILEAIKHCKKLQKLALYSDNIGDEGAKLIAETVKYFPNLELLNLYHSEIGDEGAKAFIEMIKSQGNNPLKTFNFSENNMGQLAKEAALSAWKESGKNPDRIIMQTLTRKSEHKEIKKIHEIITLQL